MKVLVVEGTVRDGRKSIHAADYLVEKLEEKGHRAELFDIKKKEIPLLNHTRYSENEHPEDVEEYGQKVESSDVIVLVCPEYNHSMPGALKNLIDYLYPEYEDKPFGYVTVSGGNFGGVRALSHLHDVTLEVGGFPGPDLPVSKVGQTFSEDGELQDEAYEERFGSFVEKLETHVEKIDA